MRISQRGLDLIKEFESYLKPLPDGRCTTYICPAGVPTIGWGCTKGVKVGDVWTREQAEERLRGELAKIEAAVTRLVTVEINQCQFDALVSLAYNIGDGGLSRSSVLRHLNNGNVAKAAESFALWNKAKVKGKMTELRGLTRRRAAERALFLSEPEDAEPEPMPQKIEAPPVVTPETAAKATGAGALLGGGGLLMADPVSVSSSLVAVKGNAGQLLSGVDIALWSVPVLICVAVIAFLMWSRK